MKQLRTNFSFDPNTYEIVNTLYSEARGFVKLINRKNDGISSVFCLAENFSSEKYVNYLNNKKFSNKNLYMSMSTFRRPDSATLDDILSVCCLCIDMDYKFTDKNGKHMPAEDVYRMFQTDMLKREAGIPMPSYIELGHRIRLVYIFSSPVKLPADDESERKNTVSWLKRIMTIICENVNSLNPGYNAEIQQLTKFVRVPGSFNIKWNDMKYRNGSPVFLNKTIYQISTVFSGKLWDVHELAEFVLPKLPSWYRTWKNTPKKKRKGKAYSAIHTDALMDKYINLLKLLQDNLWDVGYRETMSFLYWNFLMSKTDYRETIAVTSLRSFNGGFVTPLSDRELTIQAKPKKTYRYSLKTLQSILNIPDYILSSAGFKCYDKTEYNRKYMKELRKKNKDKRQADKLDLIRKVKNLSLRGFSVLEIAQKVKVSASTVRRYAQMHIDKSHSAVKSTCEANYFGCFSGERIMEVEKTASGFISNDYVLTG